MTLVIVSEDIDGMRLRPVGIEGICLIAGVEVAFIFYHERFDEGICHRVCLCLVSVFNKFIQVLDDC